MNRHRLRGKSIVLALAAVAVVAGGTQAWADPIRFDNPAGPGHFDWFGGTSQYPIGLEVISDAASQTGAMGGIAQFAQSNTLPGGDVVSGGLGGELQVGGAYGDSLLGVDFGTEIPSGLAWLGHGYIWYPGDPEYLPLEEETYLGIRFPLYEGGPWHYGWIGVVMSQSDVEQPPHGYPYQLDAFAWGYETDPGVAIPAGVPEPGSLALLAMGAVGVLSRRRK